MPLTEHVKQKLEQALPGAKVRVFDLSAAHAEHNSTGAHLAVQVIHSSFRGKTLVEQHQMIYKILQEEMKEQIHALKLDTKSE